MTNHVENCQSSAQKRWKILARALSSSSSTSTSSASSQSIEQDPESFDGFDLLQPSPLDNDEIQLDLDCTWWEYAYRDRDQSRYQVSVSRLTRCFSPDELVGFNNTGNVRVWPSEECLAFYLLRNPEICRERRVLELGGGMSCLAGVLQAKYGQPREMVLTDGNPTSVENVGKILEKNGLMKEGNRVRCAVLKWGAKKQQVNNNMLFA